MDSALLKALGDVLGELQGGGGSALLSSLSSGASSSSSSSLPTVAASSPYIGIPSLETTHVVGELPNGQGSIFQDPNGHLWIYAKHSFSALDNKFVIKSHPCASNPSNAFTEVVVPILHSLVPSVFAPVPQMDSSRLSLTFKYLAQILEGFSSLLSQGYLPTNISHDNTFLSHDSSLKFGSISPISADENTFFVRLDEELYNLGFTFLNMILRTADSSSFITKTALLHAVDIDELIDSSLASFSQALGPRHFSLLKDTLKDLLSTNGIKINNQWRRRRVLVEYLQSVSPNQLPSLTQAWPTKTFPLRDPSQSWLILLPKQQQKPSVPSTKALRAFNARVLHPLRFVFEGASLAHINSVTERALFRLSSSPAAASAAGPSSSSSSPSSSPLQQLSFKRCDSSKSLISFEAFAVEDAASKIGVHIGERRSATFEILVPDSSAKAQAASVDIVLSENNEGVLLDFFPSSSTCSFSMAQSFAHSVRRNMTHEEFSCTGCGVSEPRGCLYINANNEQRSAFCETCFLDSDVREEKGTKTEDIFLRFPWPVSIRASRGSSSLLSGSMVMGNDQSSFKCFGCKYSQAYRSNLSFTLPGWPHELCEECFGDIQELRTQFESSISIVTSRPLSVIYSKDTILETCCKSIRT